MLPEQIVEAVLDGTKPILEAPLEGEMEALMEALRARGLRAVRVDQAPVFDKDTLLHALYQSCALPAWFGFNWDALADTLGDDDIHEAKSVVLVFGYFSTLRQRSPDTCDTFLDILAEATDLPHSWVRQALLLN
ncbi:barstar family protein [Ectothiorhodospira lacustris]|uniref:barstar family protein n=1 Tax=Ectothiorhodospira lacustris TaxID=2899127 RepID=UPI001EE8E2BD|nr:barstar family protein [Ectothiorhodospira lacustris]MCG5509740.1 barstar family protein [Ectothiorhodospira lacustris]MCG5522346.1 barstar family protein [Ectothiorhodospira lacustris]